MLLRKVNFLDMNRKELEKFFFRLGEESFRAHQVMKWIYHHYCSDFNNMTDLSRSLRIKLNQIAEIKAPIIAKEKFSADGTIKWSMQVDSHQEIETVYIPESVRSTVCVSSQIGCMLGCSFCGTAQQGFNRNLRVSEIIGQVWRIAKFFSCSDSIKVNNNIPITHVVFMGMGEPLLNFMNVISSIKIILDSFAFGLSKKHVIISTAGIVPFIDKLKKTIDNIPLAISLHAPNDIIRSRIMPINKKYNISDLLQAVRRYLIGSTVNHGKVTIEYVLLQYINDDISHAHQLVKLLHSIPCKINLIPWNPISNVDYICSSNTRTRDFLQILLQHNIVAIVRKIRGVDIDAACGQLTGIVNNRIKSGACNLINNTNVINII